MNNDLLKLFPIDTLEQVTQAFRESQLAPALTARSIRTGITYVQGQGILLMLIVGRKDLDFAVSQSNVH
jgi:hypothetical protein